MAHIPADAKWYLAEIVEEIKIKGERKNVIHINMVLVRADTPEDAYDKALELGKQSDLSYENTEGKPVTITFRGLRDLHVIYDELEHGAEIIYEERVGLTRKQIDRMIRSKDQLNIFRDMTPRPIPNYMPQDVQEEIEKLLRSGDKP